MSTYSIQNQNLVFNVSRGKDNYSQRNNQFKWVHPKNPKLTMEALSMCNVTSMVMALDYAAWSFPAGKYNQPEDNLCDFIFTDAEVLEFYKKKMPAMYNAFERGDTDAFCPNLVHDVLAFGTNKWIGASNAVKFRTDLKITDVLSRVVLDNLPVVMSGTFPYQYNNGTIGTLGHINTLVGVVYDMAQVQKYSINLAVPTELEKVLSLVPSYILVDDPYGAYNQNFKQGTGNDVVMPFGDFIKCYKPINDINIKWGHLISRGAATI